MQKKKNFSNLKDSSNSPSPPVRTPEVARTTQPTAADKPTKPCCKAIYDFEPENPTELEFKEGDIIELKEKVDDNWFEGHLRGKTGLFPIAYVQIVVPLNK